MEMDLFYINGQDGISLPEMIDWDIKLCDSDIKEEIGVNNFTGLGYELPSLDIEEDPNPMWTQHYSANSNSSFELDFLGEGASALMVNPSSVVPFLCSRRRLEVEETKSSEAEEYSKVSLVDTISQVSVKKESVKMEEKENDTKATVIKVEEFLEEDETVATSEQPQDILSMPIEFVNVAMENSAIKVLTPSKKTSQKRQVMPCIADGSNKPYPKPAYSYSCLIAMALKNSQSGCLPVSEIYSFMCHHFPYFKTAPNGWKNSVRHNLSLNKCFEKIEKPPSSGNNGSQRKGCLWAMNPAKISKMDEEVAKWSRKDPSAIKKAMVYPDNLELLERGELKDEAAFDSEEVEEDTEEVREEEAEEDFGVDAEDERISPIDDDSDDEISSVPPSLQPFEPKFALLNQRKLTAKTINQDQSEEPAEISVNMDFEISEDVYDELEVSDTKALLGFDDSIPIYAVDPTDENVLIELPMVKRPRVQANYICQPVLNMKRHNISGFRSIKIQSP
ncbi:uncharacterized protein LOC128993949 [Macrosteles quadrilineatus]|uniref:uncharacterized protein LOC128993949 n=1 Tax=Macrosteles quadrilineatus TaxID=74068 RepID=UPI0023E28BB6|nr:uncharacterized protein LOC128993949 [Macrosteles quadrilineatus]